LTPLGDPPLFIGFLKGVPFSWTIKHMAAPMLLATTILLIVFFVMDRYLFTRELRMGMRPPDRPGEAFGIEGTVNLALLVVIIGVVLVSGLGQPTMATINLLSVPVEISGLARSAALLAIALTSLALTRREVRQANGFSWFPIMEVAKLFAAIFVTVVPVMAILRAGPAGGLAWLTALVDGGGKPNPVLYFWLTGVLSSFLDNAPTYLVFFEAAGGDAQRLIVEEADTLLAISAGAVLMGANTYIGNAPNFMVRSISVESGVAMPGFFGFVGWGLVFLVPIWILMTAVFFL
jgi:Na+/H+ antiporter NhaD/arsenite permease-like protein